MRVVRVVAAAMLAFSVLWGPPAPVRAAQAAEEFTAIAANISNVGAAGLVPVTIHVSRWTPEEEHARLFDILRESGQEAFLKALLQQKPVGWIATPTSLRYDFFYARQDQRDGGEVEPRSVRRFVPRQPRIGMNARDADRDGIRRCWLRRHDRCS